MREHTHGHLPGHTLCTTSAAIRGRKSASTPMWTDQPVLRDRRSAGQRRRRGHLDHGVDTRLQQRRLRHPRRATSTFRSPPTPASHRSSCASTTSRSLRARYWGIDDVFVGQRDFPPVPGGLVVGTVQDANTGQGAVDATVTDDSDRQAQAQAVATPEDPNLADGYYSLFVPGPGKHTLTAAKFDYVLSVANGERPRPRHRRGELPAQRRAAAGDPRCDHRLRRPWRGREQNADGHQHRHGTGHAPDR